MFEEEQLPIILKANLVQNTKLVVKFINFLFDIGPPTKRNKKLELPANGIESD
jgi:hypothetical protein